jgi:Class III cytochrome C family
MKRIGGGVFALTLLWGILAWGTVGPTEPPSQSWLRIAQPRHEQPSVLFSHRRHSKPRITCEQCHHDYRRGRNLWREGLPVEKCQSCHRLIARRGVLDAQDAFHRQCKGCHLSRRKLRQPAGPIKCEGCHRRTERGECEGLPPAGKAGATPLRGCV